MRFSEKLNFLMDITKTTNSALSLYVSLDASYISRLRSGKRLLPRNRENIIGMAGYFARNCKDAYQKKAIEDALGSSPLPKDVSALAESIAEWLLEEKESGTETIGQFLGGLTAIHGRTMPAAGVRKSPEALPDEEMLVYYGVEGKRRAVEIFLNEVVALEKPQTLLLFSDEETSWMTEDPAFTKQWLELMVQTLSRGHRIKIIHTINRDLDAMLSAIGQWMPLYMAGTIEPYFYPKKRDGVFKRTLFIAPGKAAVVSNSVGDQTSRAANLLFRDPEAVSSYEEEFLQYFQLCRPLMRIFNTKNRKECLAVLAEFEKTSCSTIIKTESLSSLTMPETLFCSILHRLGMETAEALDYQRPRTESFLRTIGAQTFSEIISLPDPSDIKEGRVRIALPAAFGGEAAYYTKEEYILHLRSVIETLETHENYNVQLAADPAGIGYMVYVKEDMGAIVVKTSPPPVVLVINEGNMTAAFWDYFEYIIRPKANEKPDNKETARRLIEFVKLLEYDPAVS